MLLAWAVSCESYELREDGTADIFGAGFDTFRVESLPVELEVSILVRLFLTEDERGQIELHVLGPDTKPLGMLSHEVVAAPGRNHRSGFLVSQTEALETRFPAETVGVYSVEIYTDRAAVSEDRRRSIFFNVREGLPE